MVKSKDREREKKSRKRSRDERDVVDSEDNVSKERHSRRKHSSSSNAHKKSSRKHDKDKGSSSSSNSKRDHSREGAGKDREKERKKSSSSSHGTSSSSRKGKEKESSFASKSKERHSGRDKNRRKDDEGTQAQDIAAVEIPISAKDYFTRAKEFKVWLYQKKKGFFEDLTSEKSHELFGKFVKEWNRGKLDPQFYEGRLPEELVARTKKTQHKWGFVKKLTDRDQMQLATANDSVHSSTEKVQGVTSNVPAAPVGSHTASSGGKNALMPPPSRGKSDGASKRSARRDDRRDNDDDKDVGGRRTERKRQHKVEKDKHAVVLDEIAPKETGRQAIIDKRREVGARTHAAAREREDAADGLNMRETDTMGGGDSFQDVLARSKGHKQRRQTAQQERLMGLAAKEEEKRAAFLAQMGLKPGQKITIQPRNDG